MSNKSNISICSNTFQGHNCSLWLEKNFISNLLNSKGFCKSFILSTLIKGQLIFNCEKPLSAKLQDQISESDVYDFFGEH